MALSRLYCCFYVLLKATPGVHMTGPARPGLARPARPGRPAGPYGPVWAHMGPYDRQTNTMVPV